MDASDVLNAVFGMSKGWVCKGYEVKTSARLHLVPLLLELVQLEHLARLVEHFPRLPEAVAWCARCGKVRVVK